MHALPKTGRTGPWRTLCRLAAAFALLIATWQPTISSAAPKPARGRPPAEPASDPITPAEYRKLIAELAEMDTECRGFCYPDNDRVPEPGLLTVEIKGPKANDATLALLERLPHIGHLILGPGQSEKLKPRQFTDTAFYLIARLKDLKLLTLRKMSIPRSSIENLGELRKLSWIEIDGCDGVTDKTLRQLTNCRAIEELRLCEFDDRVTAQGFAHLASIRSLKKFQVRRAAVTDEALKQLAQSKSLEFLALDSPTFSDEGLLFIAGMKRLQSLSLTGSNATSNGLRHFKSAHGLRGLRLTRCRVDDDSLVSVGQCSSLFSLSLCDVSLTDAGLAHLNGLTKLTYLGLEHDDHLTGAGLASLAALRNLLYLNITGDRVSNAVFRHLHQFPNLNGLTVGHGKPTNYPGDFPGITDDGLKLIDNKLNLSQIHFDGTGITDQGLESLRALPQMHNVQWTWSPGITRARWCDPIPGP